MDEELIKLRATIAKEVPHVDVRPYSHNIIGLALSEISRAYGIPEANKAIRDFKLKRKGWSEVPEDAAVQG